MRVGTIPAVLVLRAHRLDANFYIGDEEERDVAGAQVAVEKAQKNALRAQRRLEARNELRKTLGIVLEGK